MSIDESKWQEVDPSSLAYEWSLYKAIRINTTTGTAAYDPPTVEVLSGDDTWICIYSGGNNGIGWGNNNTAFAFLLDEINESENADLVDWLESNAQAEVPST